MKDLRPFPRPVEAALPPRATVIADKTALFPPKSANQSIGFYEGIFDPYFRCGLQNELASRLKKPSNSRFRTDDKVDLRSKVELEQLVAHELSHFDIFDNPMLSDTLFEKISFVIAQEKMRILITYTLSPSPILENSA